MEKDNNSDKRFALNQKIISKERASDDIHLEGQQTQDRIDNFAYTMMKSFRDFQEIEERSTKEVMCKVDMMKQRTNKPIYLIL